MVLVDGICYKSNKLKYYLLFSQSLSSIDDVCIFGMARLLDLAIKYVCLLVSA